jgi:ATP phosphoribosyltransferase regulatory subunit
VEIRAALDDLQQLATDLADLPVQFDLADLRGYHYHSGVVFAAYGGNSPVALALGGRYDSVGRAFGRGRPATGFSLDLRDLAAQVADPLMPGAILASGSGVAGFNEAVARLREAGRM